MIAPLEVTEGMVARRQLDAFLVDPSVRDLFEQVADQVEAGRALVV